MCTGCKCPPICALFQSRSEVEKTKRKLEGDLHVAQEAVAEMERNRGELAQAVQRKEKEMAAVAAKIEDEQSLAAKLMKQVKELGVSLHRLEQLQ
jgi:septal ring factor EnvC (AmiA/AmiB activator)